MAQNTPSGFPAQGVRATPEKRRRSRPRGDEEFLRGGRKNTIIITNDANATREAEGFLYIVSSLGVTGTREEIRTDLASIVEVVRQNTSIPCAIGFGISTPEQAEKMAGISDGAIVGSAIIQICERYGKDAPAYVGEYVREMKEAVRRGKL